MRKWTICAAILGAVALAAGCSSSSDPKAEAAPPSSQNDDPQIIFGGDLVNRDGTSCVTQVHEAEALPFDLYVLFDQSGSMSTPAGAGSRLDAVRAAIADFLRADASGGMGLGIGYFGKFPIGQASCNPDDYEAPAVPIGLLPANASKILDSLAAIEPTGETPTGAALRGACTYAKQWRGSNPGKNLDILVLTDGIPEAPVTRTMGSCDPTLDDATAAARECVEAAGVKTYVLGVGPSLDNLDRIATAGGTGHAFLVDSKDVTKDVTEALGRIRGSALPCSFKLPPPPSGEEFAFDQVNVVVTDTAGTDHALVNVPTASDCAEGGGWYYAGDPVERIELCESTCNFTKAQSDGGRIDFALGCRTQTTTR